MDRARGVLGSPGMRLDGWRAGNPRNDHRVVPLANRVPGLFPSFIAVVDIALVFVIFKGDVRIT
jgi:hypothetical protein